MFSEKLKLILLSIGLSIIATGSSKALDMDGYTDSITDAIFCQAERKMKACEKTLSGIDEEHENNDEYQTYEVSKVVDEIDVMRKAFSFAFAQKVVSENLSPKSLRKLQKYLQNRQNELSKDLDYLESLNVKETDSMIKARVQSNKDTETNLRLIEDIIADKK